MVLRKLGYVEIDGDWGTMNLIVSVYSKIYSKRSKPFSYTAAIWPSVQDGGVKTDQGSIGDVQETGKIL